MCEEPPGAPLPEDWVAPAHHPRYRPASWVPGERELRTCRVCGVFVSIHHDHHEDRREAGILPLDLVLTFNGDTTPRRIVDFIEQADSCEAWLFATDNYRRFFEQGTYALAGAVADLLRALARRDQVLRGVEAVLYCLEAVLARPGAGAAARQRLAIASFAPALDLPERSALFTGMSAYHAAKTRSALRARLTILAMNALRWRLPGADRLRLLDLLDADRRYEQALGHVLEGPAPATPEAMAALIDACMEAEALLVPPQRWPRERECARMERRIADVRRAGGPLRADAERALGDLVTRARQCLPLEADGPDADR